VTAVLGPTNTGKTHLAVERMLGHHSGMIGLPLRLLAREIYDRVVAVKGKSAVALVTGEEKIMPRHPTYYVCTVEAMPLDITVAFLAVDEIQLCADPERGHVFTDRLLRARGTDETMFLGADTVRAIIHHLLPDVEFISRPRFSRLEYSGPRKLSRLPPRSAIVAFSIPAIYEAAELIRRQRGGAAIVMGALSPRTRNAQVELFESGEVDFIVATDAIGMGLNLNVDHVAFMSLAKFDGRSVRELYAAEIAQIAGRAGRHLNDGTFGTTGDAGQIDPAIVERVTEHRFPAIEVLQWRNSALDFGSVAGLIHSLQQAPPAASLRRTGENEDLFVLRTLARDTRITDMTRGPAAVRLLWEVCRIPDFRKTMPDVHARLLGDIYTRLATDDGVLPTDWLARQIDRLDRVDGDIDTLQNRLAHVRTWNYVANRPGWLKDSGHWRERVSEIEDRLSNALHTSLTQRFVDRRGSMLARRNEDDLIASVDASGRVLVEGEYVGELREFDFLPDPTAHGDEQKTLVAAARKVLAGEIETRAAKFAEINDTELSFQPGQLDCPPSVVYRGRTLARIVRGPDTLSPTIQLLGNELLTGSDRLRVENRLTRWLHDHLRRHLAPLFRLREKSDAALDANARGIAFQMSEHLGAISRRTIAKQLTSVSREGRRSLRSCGVEIGEHSVYMPALLKPAPARLRFELWRLQHGHGGLAAAPDPGLMSIPVEADIPEDLYAAAGLTVCGRRAVRIDMLDRLARTLRGKTRKGPSPMDPALMSTVGCGADDFAEILSSLGYELRDVDGAAQIAPARRKRPPRQRKPRAAAASNPTSQPGAAEKPKSKPAPKPREKAPAARRRVPEKPIDKDSPFAVLQELKVTLDQGNKPKRRRRKRPKKARPA
jgi:ATP-dependent RNA helicase SUPV3L1/SUV3